METEQTISNTQLSSANLSLQDLENAINKLRDADPVDYVLFIHPDTIGVIEKEFPEYRDYIGGTRVYASNSVERGYVSKVERKIFDENSYYSIYRRQW